MFFFVNVLSYNVSLFLFISLLFSILCFFVNHSILFWQFYELSMVPLLYLIFNSSPYSERFLAGWYFSCYLLVTSLPLILTLIYLSIINNSLFFYAEATSIVSIFLSGYIMKLGLLGVYRCTYNIFGSSLINYLLLCLLSSIWFLVVACSELDGKRWLAFLSLSHIVIPFIGLFISDVQVVNDIFFYCLAHGLFLVYYDTFMTRQIDVNDYC